MITMTKKILIKGDVVDDLTGSFYEYFSMPHVSPGKIEQALAENGDEDVELSIASNGGDVFAASEIYTLIRNYPGKVTVNIEGLAASAASVIAMAGDTIRMSPTSQLMIHKAWSGMQGNADDMNHEASVLQSIDDSISNAYRQKTGLPYEKIQQLMSNETWMNAQDAVDKGFVDEIMFVDEKQPAALNSISEIPSKQAINKFMNLISKINNEPESQPKEEQSVDLLNQKLAILKRK